MTELTLSQKKAARAERGRDVVKDRRRFRDTPVPTGNASHATSPKATGTIFPAMVFRPTPDAPVLKSGVHNAKIGGDVLVGALYGAKIFTLTLEERATCPKSCTLWSVCYGNSMHRSHRFQHGKALEARLKIEVPLLLQEHKKILVRLHVLGDFYSWEYLCLWAELLDQYEGLNVFGFTAWQEDTQIGAGIARLRKVYPQRFAVRTSGRTGTWGSFTLDFPTEKAMIGDAVVCPEQRDAMGGLSPKNMHCGACGLCWKLDIPVAFVEH